MSVDNTLISPPASGWQLERIWRFFRRISWLLLNAYGIAVSASGFLLLAVATYTSPPDINAGLLLFLTLLSATVRWLGFPFGSLTNSLFGIVDLTTLLLFGPVVAAWQAALAVLLNAFVRLLRSSLRSPWTVFKLPLFNASVKAIMALASGSVYLLAGGRLRPQSLDTDQIVPAFLLIVTWFVLDYGIWSLLELFAGGRARFLQWTRYAVVSAFMVEFLPLPFAFLAAATTVNLGPGGLLLVALGLILASMSVNLMAQARRSLEARIAELTTLNQVSQEIIRASHSEKDICEIIYRFASQVVDTTYFLLGLLSDDGKMETIAVLVAEGQRQEPRTLTVGGVVTWMQENRRPLVVNDLHRESLPFAPRHVSPQAGMVRSALFVPMLAGENLIGFMSIQSHLPNSFTANDTRILSAIANQAAMAIANLRLRQQAEIQARLEREVRLASDIQRSLLPPAPPSVPGFEIAADWRSAREVSGDFYDFLFLPNGKLGIIIADVSDKGVPAALFMALSRSLVRAALLGAGSPAEGMRRANRLIMKDTTTDMFLTLFYAVFDPLNYTLTYVNAGHNPPLMLHHSEQECRYLDRHGIALGVVQDAVYEEYTVDMKPGDVLLCYTDGVTDAMNADGVPFGEERLHSIAQRFCTLPPDQIIVHINDALKNFIADEPAFDDATLIVARRAEPVVTVPAQVLPEAMVQKPVIRRTRWIA